MLFKEYERKVIVMIDEYDVPLQKAVVAKEPYYNKMLEIIRKLSVSTFKQGSTPGFTRALKLAVLEIPSRYSLPIPTTSRPWHQQNPRPQKDRELQHILIKEFNPSSPRKNY